MGGSFNCYPRRGSPFSSSPIVVEATSAFMKSSTISTRCHRPLKHLSSPGTSRFESVSMDLHHPSDACLLVTKEITGLILTLLIRMHLIQMILNTNLTESLFSISNQVCRSQRPIVFVPVTISSTIITQPLSRSFQPTSS
jgi:hypothetical protein